VLLHHLTVGGRQEDRVQGEGLRQLLGSLHRFRSRLVPGADILLLGVLRDSLQLFYIWVGGEKVSDEVVAVI